MVRKDEVNKEASTPLSQRLAWVPILLFVMAAVVFSDMERITDANDAFLNIIGYTRDDLCRGLIDWVKMTPQEYLSLDHACLEQLKERGSCVPFEKEYFRKGGSRVPILIGEATITRDPLTWVCFVLDLSKQKNTEAKIVDAKAQAELYLDLMCHDINNMHQVALGYLELARDMTPR